MRESGRDGKKRQGRAEVVEPYLLSVQPLGLLPGHLQLLCGPSEGSSNAESASSSWGHDVTESEAVKARHGFQHVLLGAGLSSSAPLCHPRAASDATPSAEAERGTGFSNSSHK